MFLILTKSRDKTSLNSRNQTKEYFFFLTYSNLEMFCFCFFLLFFFPCFFFIYLFFLPRKYFKSEKFRYRWFSKMHFCIDVKRTISHMWVYGVCCKIFYVCLTISWIWRNIFFLYNFDDFFPALTKLYNAFLKWLHSDFQDCLPRHFAYVKM